jgi:1-acyl-sn-glycerol-3-phosphate acyltransferase
MRSLRALWRLARCSLHLLHGIGVVVLQFGRLDAAGRHARIRWWSGRLLALAGLRLEARGTVRPGATLLAANHVSWLDIAAIHAVAPQARFVSKAEVLRWPLLGRLIQGAGTLFIERERKRDALRVVHHVAQALHGGDTVAVFPEGTTGDGRMLLPFHANLLQAAVAVGAPVQPVVLRYGDAQAAFSAAVDYVGRTTLLQSVWRVLSADGLVVHVELLDARDTRHADRRALAARLQADIGARLAAAPDAAPRGDTAFGTVREAAR